MTTNVRRVELEAEDYAAALTGSYGVVLMLGPDTDYGKPETLLKLGAIVAANKRLVLVVHQIERIPDKLRKIADAVVRARDEKHANSEEIRTKVEAAMDRLAEGGATVRTELYKKPV